LPAGKPGHAYFVGGIYAEDGGWDSPAYLSVAADQYVNGWHTLKVQVGADRIVKFHVDDNLIWTSAKKLHPSMMTGRNVALGWRSSGSAGKAYHDWVRVRNSVEITTVNPYGNGFWASGPNMSTQRYTHGAVLMPNGKVLLAGGATAREKFSSVEVYTPIPNPM
jgi:hypothetical protein